MHIDFSNKEKIKDIYIHDSIFEGFSYDYEKRQVELLCTNIHSCTKQKISFYFDNVIFFQMQSCYFFGPGVNVYDIWLDEKPPELDKLMEIQNAKAELYDHSYLTGGIQYLSIRLMINSGDELLVICESVEFTKSEPEINEKAKWTAPDCTDSTKRPLVGKY